MAFYRNGVPVGGADPNTSTTHQHHQSLRHTAPGKTKHSCPECDKSLGALHLSDTQIELCFKGCRGVWCSAQSWPELAKVDLSDVDLAKISLASTISSPSGVPGNDPEPPPQPAPLALERSILEDGLPMRCPSCSCQLERFDWAFMEVVTDRCPKCRGIWVGNASVTSLREMGMYMAPHSDEIFNDLEKRGYSPGEIMGSVKNDRLVFGVLLELASFVGYLGFVF